MPSKNSCQWLRDTIDEGKNGKTVRILLRCSPFKKHADQFFRRRNGKSGRFGKFPNSFAVLPFINGVIASGILNCSLMFNICNLIVRIGVGGKEDNLGIEPKFQ